MENIQHNSTSNNNGKDKRIKVSQEDMLKYWKCELFQIGLRELNCTYQFGKAFTLRDIDVLNSLIKGNSIKQIANELGVACKTVKYHIWKGFQYYSVQNRIQLAIAYIEDLTGIV